MQTEECDANADAKSGEDCIVSDGDREASWLIQSEGCEYKWYAATSDPTLDPTMNPTFDPTEDPTLDPTTNPTTDPTFGPTIEPIYNPTEHPTINPITSAPTEPTSTPTSSPIDTDMMTTETIGTMIPETAVTINIIINCIFVAFTVLFVSVF